MYLSLGVFITGHSYSHYLSFIVTVFSSQDVESTESTVFFTFYRYKKMQPTTMEEALFSYLLALYALIIWPHRLVWLLLLALMGGW
jgi:hypothetical protein